MSDAKRGVANCSEHLTALTSGSGEMYAATRVLDAGPARAPSSDELWVLPGFDEYLLGFKDRSLMLDDEHKNEIVPGGNGVFRATIVRAGRVIGTWKRSIIKDRVSVEAATFKPLRTPDRRRVEAEFETYARFLGRSLSVRWP